MKATSIRRGCCHNSLHKTGLTAPGALAANRSVNRRHRSHFPSAKASSSLTYSEKTTTTTTTTTTAVADLRNVQLESPHRSCKSQNEASATAPHEAMHTSSDKDQVAARGQVIGVYGPGSVEQDQASSEEVGRWIGSSGNRSQGLDLKPSSLRWRG